MRWIGVALALGVALAAVHVEPPAAALALMAVAVWCLGRTRPALAVETR